MENLKFDTTSNIIGWIIVLSIILLCLIAVKMKWLTFSGSVAALFMAMVFIWVGFETFILPLILLIGGTLLTKINHEVYEKEGRDAIQVLANGGIGILCLIFYKLSGSGYTAFLISFSISICDTFSSEIGKYYNGKTIDILTFKPIKKGLSGGITIEGTLGGLAGAIICAAIAFVLLNIQFSTCLSLLVFAMLGMILDSVLGSKFQAKYMNNANEIEEQNIGDNKLYSGYSFCTNDTVNILSNALAVGLFLLI